MSLRIQIEGPIEVDHDVAPSPTRTIATNEGARVLSILQRFGSGWVSILADDERPKSEVTIRVVGPGYPIGEDVRAYKFLDTIVFKNGEMFFHFFVRGGGA